MNKIEKIWLIIKKKSPAPTFKDSGSLPLPYLSKLPSEVPPAGESVQRHQLVQLLRAFPLARNPVPRNAGCRGHAGWQGAHGESGHPARDFIYNLQPAPRLSGTSIYARLLLVVSSSAAAFPPAYGSSFWVGVVRSPGVGGAAPGPASLRSGTNVF